jgi:hypothetical protein
MAREQMLAKHKSPAKPRPPRPEVQPRKAPPWSTNDGNPDNHLKKPDTGKPHTAPPWTKKETKTNPQTTKDSEKRNGADIEDLSFAWSALSKRAVIRAGSDMAPPGGHGGNDDKERTRIDKLIK